MEKIVGKNKKPREIATVILIVLLLCALLLYVVYAAATYINSKSPGDFKDFRARIFGLQPATHI